MNPGKSLEPVWNWLLTRAFRLLIGIYLLPVVIVIAGITCAVDLIWRCSRVLDVLLEEETGRMKGRELNSAENTSIRSRQRKTQSHAGGTTFHLMN
jgi:hypothetical protein